jgi:hypothetical protein
MAHHGYERNRVAIQGRIKRQKGARESVADKLNLWHYHGTGTGLENRAVIDLTELHQYRHPSEDALAGDVMTKDDRMVAGAFLLPALPPSKFPLAVIASAQGGWDHVSVSCEKRIPKWLEMEYVKRLFFLPGEVAMQLHVGESDHININPNVLHIWRPHDELIPLPPSIMV